MTDPGRRLRAMSARLCSVTTMERLIDPVLADLQTEYAEAHRRGQTWRGRWILVAGYVAFLKVATICACEQSIRALRNWPADERRVWRRTIALCVAAMLAATVFIIFWPMLQFAGRFGNQMGLSVYVYDIPQALPIAIPVGVTLGLFVGLGGRVVSPRLRGLVLATALACSAVTFATMAWIVPAAGEEWRKSVAHHVRLTKGAQVTLTKGPLELTPSELRQKIAQHTQVGRSGDARRLRFSYQMRLALPCATFALSLFGLSVMPRRPVKRWILGAAGFAACVGYYVLLAAGEFSARQGIVPPFAAAWLPNVVFALVSAALLITDTQQSRANENLSPPGTY